MELLDLCYDVLIRILEEINPEDLAACARASWGFNNFIKDNQALYKSHYLRNYVCSSTSCYISRRLIREQDDPRWDLAASEPDWVQELQRLVKFEKMMSATGTEEKVWISICRGSF